jgi:hypothetical protein
MKLSGMKDGKRNKVQQLLYAYQVRKGSTSR